VTAGVDETVLQVTSTDASSAVTVGAAGAEGAPAAAGFAVAHNQNTDNVIRHTARTRRLPCQPMLMVITPPIANFPVLSRPPYTFAD
jgi:hypothetical protein